LSFVLPIHHFHFHDERQPRSANKLSLKAWRGETVQKTSSLPFPKPLATSSGSTAIYRGRNTIQILTNCFLWSSLLVRNFLVLMVLALASDMAAAQSAPPQPALCFQRCSRKEEEAVMVGQEDPALGSPTVYG
jgi:hypothetical protein